MTEKPIQVLLVEDNSGDARLIREHLADAGAGFKIENVLTLAIALERCSRPGIDLVLLDLGLPDSVGLDTLKAFRASVPELPVVVLTSLAEEQIAVQAVQLGAQDYLIKGESSGVLTARALRYAIERKRAEEALQESEELKSLILSVTLSGIIVIDAATRKIVEANDAALRLIGLPKERVIGSVCHQFVCPAEENNCPILDLGQDVDYSEKILLSADGKRKNIIKKVASIQFRGQRYLLESFVDITERKRAEEERKTLLAAVEQEKIKLSAVIDGIADEVWFADEQKKFTLANPTALREFNLAHGKTIEVEKLAKNLEVLRPDGSPRPVEEAPPLRALLGEVIKNQEEIVRTPATGELRYRQVSSTPIKNPAGSIIGSVSVVHDITERKRAEAALVESKALVETVVENVPLMIFLKEAQDLRFVIFNRAGEELLGYDRKALLGKNNLDLFPPEQAAHFIANDREVLDGAVGMLDIPEEHIMTAKKGQRLLHTRKVCIRGADGITKYLLGISEDITEHKQAEAEIAKQLDELRRWQAVTLGREGRILEVKKEVNELLKRLGEPPRYGSVEAK